MLQEGGSFFEELAKFKPADCDLRHHNLVEEMSSSGLFILEIGRCAAEQSRYILGCPHNPYARQMMIESLQQLVQEGIISHQRHEMLLHEINLLFSELDSLDTEKSQLVTCGADPVGVQKIEDSFRERVARLVLMQQEILGAREVTPTSSSCANTAHNPVLSPLV